MSNAYNMNNTILDGKDFSHLVTKISKVIQDITGNKLGEKQSFMVETRLKKRMLELNVSTPEEYMRYFELNYDKESQSLVSLLTTHHTFFFREFLHFEMLKKILPELVKVAKKRPDKCIKIWSAACSRGQEAYSLAMFMDYHLLQLDSQMDFKILGTDIDSESVGVANNGVYSQDEIKEIPMQYLGSHFAKGTGDISNFAKIKNYLREKCTFKTGNLLSIEEAIKGQEFDIVFCRNVFIYFEQPQIEQICKVILKHMSPQGYFFTGISESLSGMKLNINSIGPSVYTHRLEPVAISGSVSSSPTPQSAGQSMPSIHSLKGEIGESTLSLSLQPDVIRVLCVDDSGSILTLLKKILGKDQGFEVVDTALNGKEAMEKLKTLKVDLITLDIHMPEMDGLTYLEKNYRSGHPPVVMITSVSRADSDVALKALKLGASDYVEKPALNNLEERGEEIRTKLRSVFSNFKMKGASQISSQISSIDKDFQTKVTVKNPSEKIRIIFASISDLPKLKRTFSEFPIASPPSIVFFEGNNEILESYTKEAQKEFRTAPVFLKSDTTLVPDGIYFADFRSMYPHINSLHQKKPTSILVMGMVSKQMSESILKWENAHLLLEDLGKKTMEKHPLKEVATDIVPSTSFPYMSQFFFSQKN